MGTTSRRFPVSRLVPADIVRLALQRGPGPLYWALYQEVADKEKRRAGTLNIIVFLVIL